MHNDSDKSSKEAMCVSKKSMGKTDLSCMLQTSKLSWLKLPRLSCWIWRKSTGWLLMNRRRKQPWNPLLGFSQMKLLWNKGQPKIMENSNLLSFKSKTTSTTNTKLHKDKSLQSSLYNLSRTAISQKSAKWEI